MAELKQPPTTTTPFVGALVVLAHVARGAGTDNVTNVIRAATRKWNDMIGVPTLLRQFVPAIIALTALPFELLKYLGGGVATFGLYKFGASVANMSACLVWIIFAIFARESTRFVGVVLTPLALDFTHFISIRLTIFAMLFAYFFRIGLLILTHPFPTIGAVVRVILTYMFAHFIAILLIPLTRQFACTSFTFRLHPIFARFLSIPEFSGHRVDRAALGTLFSWYIRGMIIHSFSPSATEEPVGVDAPRLALFVPFIIPQMRGEIT